MASLHNTLTPECGWRAMFVDKVVIGVFAIISTCVALADFEVLPISIWSLAVPAFIATFVVEIILHRHLFIKSIVVHWGILAVFIYLQSLAIGLLYRLTQDAVWRP